MNRLLIVRMSALGDIVHALPVLAALRESHPALEIDWLVDQKYSGVLDFVTGLTQRIHGRPSLSQAVATMRARQYDVAIDLQGLLKSAAMARLSGATRVIGFEQGALRERAAAWFYSDTAAVPTAAHVIHKNLSVLAALGISSPPAVSFPWRIPDSSVAGEVAQGARSRGAEGFVLLNPGAAWPNKRWPPDRFGALAQRIRVKHGLPAYVLWGGAEAPLADAVVEASQGAATRAPATTVGDILALASQAALMVSGDTGPLHLAAAVGAPVVGLYGPTWPERNGPWHPDDVVVSRAGECECHHKRQCRREERADGSRMCLMDISVDDVAIAVGRRLSRAGKDT